MPRSRPTQPADPVQTTAQALPDLAGSSEGMPSKTPSAGRSRPGKAQTPQDAADEASLALPHERDQSTDMTEPQPDAKVKQASQDLKNKLQDTGQSPPMNRTYEKLRRG